MAEPRPRNFAFGTGAGNLRQALAEGGRRQKVFGLSDNLGCGPIDPPDIRERIAWLDRVAPDPHKDAGFFGHGWLEDDSEGFWAAAFDSRYPKIVWMSRRTAGEYCGFLEWVWRLGDTPYQVVDVTNLEVTKTYRSGELRREPVECLSWARHDWIRQEAMWSHARTLRLDERRELIEEWRLLRRENAALRLLHNGRFVSAPIERLDEALLAAASEDWQSALRVSGAAYSAMRDLGMDETTMPSGRLNLLIADGRLAHRIQGRPEVRLS